MKKRIRFASHDYLYSSLPTTRKDAFTDVYKHNFSTILKSGLTLLISCIPLFVFLLVMDVGKMGMTLDFYSEEDLEGVLLLWDIILNIGFIFLFYIVIICLCGVLKILKLLVFQEGISFFYDFKSGIKENVKDCSLIYIIYSLIYLATYFIQLYFLPATLAIVLLVIFYLLFTPLMIWIILSINVYKTKLWDYIKNGAFFFFKTALWSILFLLLVIWPVVVSFLFNQNFIPVGVNTLYIAIKYAVLIITAIFYYPCLIIVSLLFSLSKFL